MLCDDVVSMRVKGPAALFADPAFKSNPISYDVITPSAAYGLLCSVYYKPEFIYDILKIGVCNPIKRSSMGVNETSAFPPKSGNSFDLNRHRAMRTLSYLCHVNYIIEARIRLVKEENERNCIDKHRSVFLKRVDNKKSFRQPFLGRKDFVADISKGVDGPSPLSGRGSNRDFGLMFHSYCYDLLDDGVYGRYPRYYRPVMKNGWIDVEHAEIIVDEECLV